MTQKKVILTNLSNFWQFWLILAIFFTYKLENFDLKTQILTKFCPNKPELGRISPEKPKFGQKIWLFCFYLTNCLEKWINLAIFLPENPKTQILPNFTKIFLAIWTNFTNFLPKNCPNFDFWFFRSKFS